jgi:translation initiation factor eIF-2B subunit delta
MIPTSLEALIEELAGDNTSGAAEIASRGSELLALFADEAHAQDASSFLRQLVATGKALIRAQPSMAPLFNLVNSAIANLEGVQDVGAARKVLKRAAEAYGEELGRRSERIGEQALALLTDGSSVLTHSRSSTVLAVLLLARERGLDFEVLCTESRPIYEGRAVAARLAQEGIEVTLITDSAAGHGVSRADVVLVGADSVARDGLVNKMGTYPLALAARAQSVPFYALCSTEKFLPADYPYFHIGEQDPQEVWPGHPQEVKVLNLYFDVTPLEYVSGVVTENGILSRAGLEEVLGRLRVHEMLLEH